MVAERTRSFSPPSQASAPGAALDALALLHAQLRAPVERLTARLAWTLEFVESPASLAARVETRCPHILLVDTDLVGAFEELAGFACSLRPDVRLLAVTCYWSDRDDSVRGCADAILHKPVRRNEWERVFDRIGIPRIGGADAPVAAAATAEYIRAAGAPVRGGPAWRRP